MYYSLTFTVNGVEKNTWSDWNMIPSTPPMIPAPEPNTNYVDIPGRSGGPIDLTGTPFGKITYKRMTGSWSFLREPDNANTRKNLYETLVKYFTGRPGKVVLEEDPTHYYKGRFSVGVPQRYNVSNDTVDTNYARETVITI